MEGKNESKHTPGEITDVYVKMRGDKVGLTWWWNLTPEEAQQLKNMVCPELKEENENLKKEIANHQVVNSLMAGDDLEVSLSNKVFELTAEVDRLTKEKSEIREVLDEVFKTTSGGWTQEFRDKVESFLTRIK